MVRTQVDFDARWKQTIDRHLHNPTGSQTTVHATYTSLCSANVPNVVALDDVGVNETNTAPTTAVPASG